MYKLPSRNDSFGWVPVNRCCTRGESVAGIGRRRESMQTIHPIFKTKGRHHKKSTTGLSVAPQKDIKI